MQFVSFGLVSVALVFAVQVVLVSTHPIFLGASSDKPIPQLHEEFKAEGVKLQNELKAAREREDFKEDAHVQAYLNAIEETDKKVVLLVDAVVDPKHRLSTWEARRLGSEVQGLMVQANNELTLVKPEHQEDMDRIAQILLNRSVQYLSMTLRMLKDLTA